MTSAHWRHAQTSPVSSATRRREAEVCLFSTACRSKGGRTPSEVLRTLSGSFSHPLFAARTLIHDVGGDPPRTRGTSAGTDWQCTPPPLLTRKGLLCITYVSHRYWQVYFCSHIYSFFISLVINTPYMGAPLSLIISICKYTLYLIQLLAPFMGLFHTHLFHIHTLFVMDAFTYVTDSLNYLWCTALQGQP